MCLVRFGHFELDPVAGELCKNGRKLRLPAQALEVLVMLLDRPGELVTREQLNARLWPNGTIVEFDHGINSCIRRLRAALNDSAEQPRYIETLPKRGYRFIFPLESEPVQSSAIQAAPATQYRIVSKLGAGAMGVVYRATDNRLGRDVALKFPIETILSSPRMLDAFEREARAAAALNHPNICTVYGVGEQDGRPFIAMELVEGETLEAILSRRELSIEEAVAIAIQVASALDAAHSRGIVHRDIKPGNIFVSGDHAVKVVDFGIAKCPTEVALGTVLAAGDGRATPALSTTVGTPRYMAPEQLEGHAADARSDIFSFGVTLYEMITRRRPFEGDEPEALAAAIRSSPPRSVGELRADVPAKLARIVHRCLQTDPAARWQTAHELVTELGSVSVRRRSPKWVWAVVGALAAVVLIVAGALYWRNANAAPINSIAVLPFTNATRDANTEYITDGITEGIINSLSAAPGLKVIARTTAFTFKDKDIDPQAVGRQLGVQAVLIGKISQRGDSIFIQTDLVNVADRAQLWGEHFRRSVVAIQSLQTDIAGEIADKLRLRLAGEERKQVTKPSTENSEAFHLYLKAMYAPDTHSETEKRIDLLKQAIAKDPGFAQAYVALGKFYRMLHEAQVWPAAASLQKSREAIIRALDLDPGLGEAHVELAISLWSQEWDWAGAEREFQRALELNAGIAHAEYGRFLAQIGRTQEARNEAQRAVEIDPLSPGTLTTVMFIYLITRDYDQALGAARRAGPMVESFALAFGAEGKGQYEEAISVWEKHGGTLNVGGRGHLGHAYAMNGRQADARRIVRELQVRAQKDGIGAYEIAFIHAALRDKDEAFKWLDVAYRNHDSGLKFLKIDSHLDLLRSDPRFQELERRVGFPQ
jgi:eukaryotic-like serine/threonine-protein kinase